MPTQISIRDSISWVSRIWQLGANDTGTWRDTVEVHINNAGVWELSTPFMSSIVVGGWDTNKYGYGSGFNPPGLGGSIRWNPTKGWSTYGLAMSGNGTVIGVWSGPALGGTDRDFSVALAQTVTLQEGFSEIVVEDSTGTVRSYPSSTATDYFRNNSFGVGYWSWGSGLNHAFTAGGVGAIRHFAILP